MIMKNKFKRATRGMITILLLSIILLVDNSRYAEAKTNKDALRPYEEKLEELNEELGTNFELASTEGDTYDELVEFYTQMTMDEFEEYIRKAYFGETEMPKENAEVIIPRSSSSQRFYYDGTNYFYVNSIVTVENGVLRYSGIESTGSRVVSYPAYKMTSYDFGFQNSKRDVKCTWKCVKCIAKNVIATGSYTMSCTFRAGGGNVYPVGQA